MLVDWYSLRTNSQQGKCFSEKVQVHPSCTHPKRMTFQNSSGNSNTAGHPVWCSKQKVIGKMQK